MKIKTKLNNGLRATLLLVLLTTATSAIAHDVEIDGIYYYLNNDNTATVTSKSYYLDDACYSGHVVIPATISVSGTTYRVDSIGIGAFNECGGLTSVTLPNSISHIGAYSFRNCTGLTSIIIPNSVSTIGWDWADVDSGPNGAFTNCTNIEEVTIGKSVTFIGTCTFNLGGENSHLRKVTCLATTPPETSWGYSGEETLFPGEKRTRIGIFDKYYVVGHDEYVFVTYDDTIYHQATLYVPRGSVDAYRNATDWGRFANIVGIDVPDEPAVNGDVNGDGVVNIIDINCVVNAILSGISDISCDMNGDGSVNISDINAIIQTILAGN